MTPAEKAEITTCGHGETAPHMFTADDHPVAGLWECPGPPDLGGPPVHPDENGCFGWPRACDHEDDVECLQAALLRRAAHDEARSPHAPQSSSWCPGCTAEGVHPSSSACRLTDPSHGRGGQEWCETHQQLASACPALRRCTSCNGRGRRFDQATHDHIMRVTGGSPAMGQAIIDCPDCWNGAVAVVTPYIGRHRG